jgi:hypothetical protein
MKNNQKSTVAEMLERLQPGLSLLAPLKVVQAGPDVGANGFFVTLQWGDRSFRFSCGCKSRSTPQAVHLAREEARRGASKGVWPLVYVPYLSPERLAEFERSGFSAVDLCGNGVIQIPEKLFVSRGGAPNRFRDSRPLNDPFSGKSALVGRAFATMGRFGSLNALFEAIRAMGGQISLPQVSKAVSALVEELLVEKNKSAMYVVDTAALMKRLSEGWSGTGGGRLRISIAPGIEWSEALAGRKGLKWAINGMFSLRRYAPFAIAGTRVVMVSDLEAAVKVLRGRPVEEGEQADIELVEPATDECLFDVRPDDAGMLWAGPVQTWIELQGGQGRYMVAAERVMQFVLENQAASPDHVSGARRQD